jgi:hypothetical protein
MTTQHRLNWRKTNTKKTSPKTKSSAKFRRFRKYPRATANPFECFGLETGLSKRWSSTRWPESQFFSLQKESNLFSFKGAFLFVRLNIKPQTFQLDTILFEYVFPNFFVPCVNSLQVLNNYSMIQWLRRIL